MLEWFRCPDEQLIPVKECLTKCRMSERCETVPYLHLAASERKWTGEASTTQLLNGTMMSFLKITQPYAIDPDSMAFAIHGTKSHSQLEEKAKELNLPSELSTTQDGRNVVDLIEMEDGLITLTDYKTWGSFKIAKCLGIVETGKKPDPSGEVYKRAGVWGAKGSPKMVKVFQIMPDRADNYETELQLNRYRVMLKEQGINVDKLRVHVIVRDGGLAVARSRGVERNTYMVPVKILDDEEVRMYFHIKSKNLDEALTIGSCTTPCDNRQCWDGIRCRDYCEVALFCSKGLIEKGGKQ